MTESRKSDGNPVEDLTRLKELILGEETAQLNRLDRRVSDLESRTNDVAEVLPAAMNRLAGDPVNRPDFERPVVNTIRSAIKRDTQSFAEALFPVLGPAIRRAVADALKSLVQRINVALENSFTIKGLRWRMESARTGVPFAQIVLRHTMLYAIQEAFLIQRGSGLVLASVHRDQTLALDEDAIAAMLTAIQSFIQDSFGIAGDEPLRSAELGEQTMWVINGPVAVLACVITGTPPRPVRDELMDLLETLHARFGAQFHDRPEGLANDEGLKSLMSEALKEEADVQVRNTRFKYKLLWIAAGILLALYLVISSVGAYQDVRFKRQVERLFKSERGYVITESQMTDGVLNLTGLKDPIVGNSNDLLAQNEIPLERVSMNFVPFQSLEPGIVIDRIRAQLNLDPAAAISLDGSEMTVTGTLSQAQIESLRNLPGSHLLIQDVNLDGVRLRGGEAARMIRGSLNAPETVSFTPGEDSMLVSGISSAAWLASAASTTFDSGGWLLDFSPLRASLSTQIDSLISELDGATFLFSRRANLVDASVQMLASAGPRLAELQSLAAVLNQHVSIELEGLGDGIGTYEKNREVARRRSGQILDELTAYGVQPDGVVHTIGSWQGGGMDPEKRRVVLRVSRNQNP